MKLSVMLFPFHGELAEGKYSASDLAKALKAGGATGVEAMTSFGDAYPDKWQDLLDACADEGLEHACLDIPANFVWTSEAERVERLDAIRRSLELAAALECPTVLLPGTRPADGMSNEEGRKLYSVGLGEAAAIAAEFGIVATIEDFGVTPLFSCRSDHVLEIVKGTGRDDVQVTWDNGNFILADEDPLHAWEAFAPLAAHVHIKDFVIDPTGQAGLKSPAGKAFLGCEIGAGAARVDDSLAAVKHSSYDGWVSLEVSIAPPVEAMQQGLAYMIEAWARV